MKNAVAGTGHVGLLLAVVPSRHPDVVAVDIDAAKVDRLNCGESPAVDADIERYLREVPLSPTATTDADGAYARADVIVVATPTDYDVAPNDFNTTSVESVINQLLDVNSDAVIVINSTVPVDFTAYPRATRADANILFSLEFLRESRAMHGSLYPLRIVVDDHGKHSKAFADLLVDGTVTKDIPVLLTDASEAEAIELFAHSCLALRVVRFNELDTYAATRRLDTAQITKGVGLDRGFDRTTTTRPSNMAATACPRRPSSRWQTIPRSRRTSSWRTWTRTPHARASPRPTSWLGDRGPQVVGMFRLVMNPASVVANLCADELADVTEKIYTRDIFRRD